VEVIVKLLFGPIAPSFAFVISSTSTKFQGKAFLRGRGQKYWGTWKSIAVHSQCAKVLSRISIF